MSESETTGIVLWKVQKTAEHGYRVDVELSGRTESYDCVVKRYPEGLDAVSAPELFEVFFNKGRVIGDGKQVRRVIRVLLKMDEGVDVPMPVRLDRD